MRGFSLIESLIVVAILFLLAGLIVLSLSPFRNDQALQTGAETIAALLQTARSRTLSSAADTQYGVSFEADERVRLFQGGSYPGTELESVILDPLVQVADVSLAGGVAYVIFKRLTGETDQPGNVTVSLRSDPASSRLIVISRTGLVGISQP